jgi:hypothetical protein
LAGQPIADDRLHPALPIGASGLLVREDILQSYDLAGEVRQILLRRVDHGETLVQLGQIFRLMARGRLQPLPDPVLQSVDPFRDHPHEIALAGAEDLGDSAHSPGHLGLHAGEFRHLVVHLPRPLGSDGGFQGSLPAGAQKKNGHEQQQNEAQPSHSHDDLSPGQGCLAKDQDDVVHGA